jgi:poly(A) polymerase
LLYFRGVVTPVVVPRGEHGLSRQDIDPDALRVLYKLHGSGFEAYLVGGSVRDLLLHRRPKDFDIGTSAHPHEVKRLFRNCWIIGRRFRLAHVRFGPKTIEVATFRRQVTGTPEPQEQHFRPDHPDDADLPVVAGPNAEVSAEAIDRPIYRDNEYGTPEEDAFRRDFTVNALFYDIGTFSIIDYTGGLEDLQKRLIRCIGDPDVRFVEDPVRMLRALVLAARLDFAVDGAIMDTIDRKGALIGQASPARLLEEYYKILRSGHARACFDHLADSGLLEHMSPELLNDDGPLTEAFEAVDAYRQRFDDAPETLSNPILAGTLLLPLGLLRDDGHRYRYDDDWEREAPHMLGQMQVARKDIERLRHLLSMQKRLLEIDAPIRVQKALMARSSFRDALTWLDIHGDAPNVVEHWERLLREDPPAPAPDEEGDRRRRRRPRRRRPFNR